MMGAIILGGVILAGTALLLAGRNQAASRPVRILVEKR